MIRLLASKLFFLSFFIIIVLSPLTSSAYDEEEVIDISTFNYGRLKIAVDVEGSAGNSSLQFSKTVDLLKRNLMWSGLFDLVDLFENIDLALKLQFVPNKEIRVLLVTPDNTVLFDHRRPIKSDSDIEPQSIRMVEEIIFQLTGERSVLRSAIAYVEKGTTGTYKIMLTDTFGEQSIELINDGNYNILPRWKPDGSALLFTTLGERGSHLRLLTFTSESITTLFRNPNKSSGGSWSGDGISLVITKSSHGDSDLYRVDTRGNILERLTKRSSTEANPRLSPDGTRLLFVSNRSGSIQIYQRNLETGDTFRMTFEGSLNVEPNWSNDGAYIVFSGVKDGRFQIFLMDQDGDFMQQVTYGNTSAEQPVWSPNGRQIVFVSKEKYEQKLYIIRADGTFKRRLTKSPPGISEFNPTWTANFKWQSLKNLTSVNQN